MQTYNFKINDRVAVMRGGKVLWSATVTKVRAYKTRTKVTTSNGYDYDQNGYTWDPHSVSRSAIVPWSDEIEARLAAARDRRTIDALRGDNYSPEQAAQIVAAAAPGAGADVIVISREFLDEVADVLGGLSLSVRIEGLPAQPRARELAIKLREIVPACVRDEEG